MSTFFRTVARPLLAKDVSMHRTLRSFLLQVAVLLCFGHSLAWTQNTIHVPADQPTIQAGINAAQNGDTVLVALAHTTRTSIFKESLSSLQALAERRARSSTVVRTGRQSYSPRIREIRFLVDSQYKMAVTTLPTSRAALKSRLLPDLVGRLHRSSEISSLTISAMGSTQMPPRP